MPKCNKKEKEYLLGIEPKYLLLQPFRNSSDELNYLRFKSLEDGNTFSIYIYGSLRDLDLHYSLDGTTWTQIYPRTDSTVLSLELNKNEVIYLKGNNPSGFSKGQQHVSMGFTKLAEGGGDLMSLIDETCKTKVIPNNYCFYSLLGSANLITAPILTATTLAPYCYLYMFSGCGALKNVVSYAKDVSPASCISYWLPDTNGGVFYNLGGATYPRSTSGIPSGWTECLTMGCLE